MKYRKDMYNLDPHNFINAGDEDLLFAELVGNILSGSLDKDLTEICEEYLKIDD